MDEHRISMPSYEEQRLELRTWREISAAAQRAITEIGSPDIPPDENELVRLLHDTATLAARYAIELERDQHRHELSELMVWKKKMAEMAVLLPADPIIAKS